MSDIPRINKINSLDSLCVENSFNCIYCSFITEKERSFYKKSVQDAKRSPHRTGIERTTDLFI